ncbi:MAG: hypothetical protein V1723_04200 [Candidatus Uhrbacteria bacterium]
MRSSACPIIVKASGERVPFNEKKLVWSIERAGASKKLSRAAITAVRARVRERFGVELHEEMWRVGFSASK